MPDDFEAMVERVVQADFGGAADWLQAEARGVTARDLTVAGVLHLLAERDQLRKEVQRLRDNIRSEPAPGWVEERMRKQERIRKQPAP